VTDTETPRRRFWDFAFQDFFQPHAKKKTAKQREKGVDGTFSVQGFCSELIEK